MRRAVTMLLILQRAAKWTDKRHEPDGKRNRKRTDQTGQALTLGENTT